MKKLPTVLKTPARVVIALGLIVLGSEVLIMVLIEIIHATILKDNYLASVAWKFVDPIVLTAIVAPALYLLVFRPLNQQAELERQLDELRRFQQLTLGRELRMKELAEEIAALRKPYSAESAGDIPVTSGSLEALHHAAAQPAAAQPIEEGQRSALLFMLEDLEGARKKIEDAHQEWMSALDVVNDPIFLHDKEFRILRCNKAYQQCAGIPFKQIIGQPYYEVFPKTGAPLAGCLRVMEKTGSAADEEEIVIGDANYRSRTFSVYSEQGAYLHSVHILEDITEHKRMAAAIIESEEHFRVLYESSRDAIMLSSPEQGFLSGNPAAITMFSCRDEQEFTTLTPASVSPEFQPDGRKSADKAQEMMRLAIENGSYSFEWVHKRVDGSEFPADVLLMRTKIGGKSVIQATVRDITERKQAEDLLRKSKDLLQSVIENVPIRVFWKDSDLRYLGCNTLFAKDAGHSSPDELIGKTDFDMGWKDQAELYRADDKAVMESGNPKLNFEEPSTTPDGNKIWLRTSKVPLRDESNQVIGILGIYEDITEHKQAEQALYESERLYRSLFENMLNGFAYCQMIFEQDQPQDFIYLSTNAAFETLTGLKNVVGKRISEVIPGIRQSDAELFDICGRVSLSGKPERFEIYLKAMQQWFWISVYSPDKGYFVAIFDVITERKQAEQTLYESERLYRSLFENMLNGFAYCQMIFEQDQPQDFIYLSVNAAFETQTGLKNVVGKRVSEVITGIRQSDANLFDIYGRVSLSGKPERFEIYVKALQQWFWISVYSPGKGYFVAIFDVITERKKAEETLKKSEALLSEMGRIAKIGGWEFDSRTGQGTWTEEVARIHDMDMEEQTSLEIGLGFYQGESRQKIEAAVRQAITDGTPYDLELEMITAKGNHKWIRTIARPIKEGGEVAMVRGSFQDITERKQAEAAIQHANRALATLSTVNRELVHATVEEELLRAICQAIVQQRGYRLAWVGYVQHDESKSIKIMAQADHDEGYLNTMQLTWAESEYGMGPSGRTIRSGATQLCEDIASDPLYLPWRDEALKHGYAASIALPLTNGDGSIFGILNVYASEVNAFSPSEVSLLEEMASDLAFGVRSLHTRHERDLALEQSRQHLEKLRNSLEDTVRAIATIVEMRDPYTAGHQVRVADLAAAIARQMVLPDEQVHAIHLAGIVHDLGKIQIPAEILSKPGRITDIEYSLIKVHPQAGYDILKGIDFPWQIALMVLQHHERLNGSGYPQGLKGDAILLEARILSVADVVEAISAHRPYRPGLGIDVALAEITKQRGIHYDPQVVDACLTLFREQHYTFKS